MRSLKINGTDFNLEVGTYSLEEFKKEFKHSFCVGRTDAEIEKVHAQLKAVAIPLPANTQTDGILKTIETKSSGAKGQGSDIGKRKS